MEINPYLRPTAHECLKSKVFDPFRDANKERMLGEMQKKRQVEQASSSPFELLMGSGQF